MRGSFKLAAQNRLPGVYEARQFVAAGGLLSYGPSLNDQVLRAAVYVDKILKAPSPLTYRSSSLRSPN